MVEETITIPLTTIVKPIKEEPKETTTEEPPAPTAD